MVTWRAVFAVGVLLLAPAVGRAADSQWLYGIHWYGSPASTAVETMTGGKGIWSLEIVLTEDSGDWGLANQLAKFQTIVNRGHTLIIRVHPRWSLVVPGPNTPETAVGDRMETFIPKVIDVAQQLSDYCHIWQIGNEMNLGFEYDIGDLTPQLYVQKYNEIRNAIKSVPSSLGPQVVLLGPVAPVDNAYLGAMCDSLIANSYDVDGFAMHAYGGSRGFFLSDIDVQADLIDSKGYTDKPIYITEWGAPVDPISETTEAGVAQFLHGAFVDLANYNADPANHDVVCACWFIYQWDDYWKNWSIEYLRDYGPSGQNNDLYDAFQYACTLNLPAGDDFGGSGTDPFISRSPSMLNPIVVEGSDAEADTFTVANGGAGTLHYTITDDAAWLSVSPDAGASTGEPDPITVTYDTDGLAVGQYGATITITDPAAANNPQTISVNLSVESSVVEPTIVNPDFEADGGFFTVASGWTAFGGNKWERVLDATRGATQGVTDIPPNGGTCGVYQQVPVTPGIIYRVSVDVLTHTGDFDVAIGAAGNGSTSPSQATFGGVSTSTSWTQVAHEFTATAGTATIFLRGRNNVSWWISGAWCLFDGVTIEVVGSANHAPTAIADASPRAGTAPLTVAFDGTDSSDPDAGDVLSYDWDFDDGSPHATIGAPAHTFESAGTYVVALTVDDGHGGTDTDTVTIEVDEATAASDFDGDGDVDLTDYGFFLSCYNGPGNPLIPANCGSADFDGDEDVDLADYGTFLGCYNGPSKMPACE
jgi:PKD repeat protein